jgi:hypothetical protein
MNMPNLASRYQRVRSAAKLEPDPRLRINGSDDPASASLMKSRREGEQQLTRAEMLSRHLLAQNRSRSMSLASSGHERRGNDYFSDPNFRRGVVSEDPVIRLLAQDELATRFALRGREPQNE